MGKVWGLGRARSKEGRRVGEGGAFRSVEVVEKEGLRCRNDGGSGRARSWGVWG